MLFRDYFLIKLHIYTWKVGCKRVKIGTYGCGRVRMDALGCTWHGGHTNKVSRGHLWSWRSVFVCYGRGNFPRHDVLYGLAKSGKNGCRWVQIGADGSVGLVGTRGTRNSKTIFEIARKWQYLATHDHCAKTSLTLGLPKNRTERVMGIISGG